MRRLLSSLTVALLLGLPAAAHAASQSANTVRGKLTVGCFKTGKDKYDGQYRYLLNGKSIAKLSSGCAVGSAESHIAIYKVISSSGSTTLVVQEGLNAYTDTQKLIFIPKSGPASYLETETDSEDPNVTQKSPTAFRLKVPVEGYAIDMNHLSRWTCLIEVDFATGKATGKAASPHEKGLPLQVCKAAVEKAPI